jgi:hypothetical protein
MRELLPTTVTPRWKKILIPPGDVRHLAPRLCGSPLRLA